MRGIFNRKSKIEEREAQREEMYPADALVDYARDGNIEGLKRLLKAGQDPDGIIWRDVTIDTMEDAPLHAAAGEGQIAAMKELLKAGADINKTIEEGWTPVLQAAMDGQADAIRFLAAQGAKLDVKETFFGHTALHKAAKLGHSEAVQVLIEKGADRTLRDRQGKTAQDAICDQLGLAPPDLKRRKAALDAIFAAADTADRKKLEKAAAAKKAHDEELANAATLQNAVKPLRPVVLKRPKP